MNTDTLLIPEIRDAISEGMDLIEAIRSVAGVKRWLCPPLTDADLDMIMRDAKGGLLATLPMCNCGRRPAYILDGSFPGLCEDEVSRAGQLCADRGVRMAKVARNILAPVPVMDQRWDGMQRIPS